MDFNNFYNGQEFETYKYLGAFVHMNGVTFRTYAPAASHVAVIGEFNDWQETPMNRCGNGQFFEATISLLNQDRCISIVFIIMGLL